MTRQTRLVRLLATASLAFFPDNALCGGDVPTVGGMGSPTATIDVVDDDTSSSSSSS
eukprot:CAMPEP_0183323510 /NCGR_PEP_ID=MMETSP0160_2-20130417/74611_1 /TAXON_ID=2839 ORGANISM="Odontella Sinensis, Strain Grunow 1884" /NCGR_SAMPLE_ID=MMETSP0160_2 /ASSEMBLY_ACC=CAM_ASM_000250 /LENGTH=56 /DNA_ID=CAMNT_0025490909 /DNA_START=33 /DNA_END=200 /DNA_ORIENTATION=+